MSFQINFTPDFERQLKKLAKKYKSLQKDLAQLIKLLKVNPEQGVHLGPNLFKVRLSISSKGKGKSGGARVITYVILHEKSVYLVYMYDKGELDNLTKEQILQLLTNAGLSR
jgi:mRNA-degrading endonuclease RelE of RelBE toxin-antitoxin system